MGLSALLNLEAVDLLAFLACGFLGSFAGSVVSQQDLAIYVSILTNYHLFLAWLVFVSRGHKAGVSLPLAQAVLTHLACMVVVAVPVAIAGHVSQYAVAFRYGIAALAVFERRWLFTGEQAEHETQPAPHSPSLPQSTTDDAVAWHEYLAQRRPGNLKAGTSLRTEYEAWLVARHKKRPRQEHGESYSGLL